MSIVQVQRTPSPSVGDESETFDFDDSRCSSRNRSISECYFAVKGAAVILPHSQSPPVCSRDSFSASEIQEHLPLMIKLLRQNDSLNMAVCLQTNVAEHFRYLVIVTTNQATEGYDKDARTLLIGMDYYEGNMSIGVVLPLLWCSEVKLTGDGGVVVYGSARTPKKADNTLLFRPTSVQTMWFVFQFLHRELERTIREMTGRKMKEPSLATENYMDRINSPVVLCAQWQQSPLDEDEDYGLGADVVRQQGSPGESLTMQGEIRRELRHVMQSLDLEQVTSRDIKKALEQRLDNIHLFKEFIEIEMLVILGQMEKPSEIFDYLYLGNEWNASNYDELMSNGVGYILNMTREVDNFFPQQFVYRKYLVSDEPSTQLLSHWNETCEFIKTAKESGKKCLVHCKKGVSRSSSTVIAYIMKEYAWSLDKAVEHVKKRRNCITPNKGFLEQLHQFAGALEASRHRHSAMFNRDESARCSSRRDKSAEPRSHPIVRLSSAVSASSRPVILRSPRSRAASATPPSQRSPISSLSANRASTGNSVRCIVDQLEKTTSEGPALRFSSYLFKRNSTIQQTS